VDECRRTTHVEAWLAGTSAGRVADDERLVEVGVEVQRLLAHGRRLGWLGQVKPPPDLLACKQQVGMGRVSALGQGLEDVGRVCQQADSCARSRPAGGKREEG
jgi:hypothetical protein